jgi:hypothetical protein
VWKKEVRRLALRALYAFRRMRAKVVTMVRSTTKSAKRSMSWLLWRGERELLLRQLLFWARNDEASQISEPRDTALFWRTQHDWDGLRADGALLGPRDAAERDAFLNLRFLFAGFTVRAWYWESVRAWTRRRAGLRRYVCEAGATARCFLQLC